MRCFRPLLIASLALAAAAPARAQEPVAAGMTRDDVVARRGAPLAERVVGDLTVLLYESACVPRCAANDVVLLREGQVLAALPAEPEPAGGAVAGAAAGDSLSAILDADVFDPAMLSAPTLFPAYVSDRFSTLHAPAPLRVRPYRLPGSFTARELAEFDRDRAADPRD